MTASWWAAAVGIVLGVIGLMVGALSYMDGLKSGIEENRVLLEEVRQTQQVHFTQREGRVKELEQGHHDIITSVATSLDDLSYRIGVHSGRHQVED